MGLGLVSAFQEPPFSPPPHSSRYTHPSGSCALPQYARPALVTHENRLATPQSAIHSPTPLMTRSASIRAGDMNSQSQRQRLRTKTGCLTCKGMSIHLSMHSLKQPQAGTDEKNATSKRRCAGDALSRDADANGPLRRKCSIVAIHPTSHDSRRRQRATKANPARLQQEAKYAYYPKPLRIV